MQSFRLKFDLYFYLGEDLTELDGEDRIAGGTYPPEGKYPSLVRIEKKKPKGSNNWRVRCLATILDRHWILSTAACFISRDRKQYTVSTYRVIVGDSKINETEPFEQIHGIERLVLHERVDVDR